MFAFLMLRKKWNRSRNIISHVNIPRFQQFDFRKRINPIVKINSFDFIFFTENLWKV